MWTLLENQYFWQESLQTIPSEHLHHNNYPKPILWLRRVESRQIILITSGVNNLRNFSHIF